MTTGPEAGYYADPSIPGYIRYWDGTQWVAGTSRPAPDLPQQAQDEPQQVEQQVPSQVSSQGEWIPEPAVNTGQIAAMQQSVAAQLVTQPLPDYEDEAAQEQTSVATMIVPSAFGARTPYSMSGATNSPFDAIPGLYRTAETEEEQAEPDVRVVELASAGSRILAKIIDLCIATVLSVPITATLMLFAHKHDHAYVDQLRLHAKTTYRTLGMDALGIALWAATVLVVILTSIIIDSYRLGRNGQTTGRRIVGVQVVRAGTADEVSSGSAGLRAFLFWLFAIIPVVDVLALGGVLWGRPYRQGLHEKISRTLSIRA